MDNHQQSFRKIKRGTQKEFIKKNLNGTQHFILLFQFLTKFSNYVINNYIWFQNL